MKDEGVLRKVGEKRSLKVTIWKRKARSVGHIMRPDDMLRTVTEGGALGKKGTRRKILVMLDDVQEGYD